MQNTGLAPIDELDAYRHALAHRAIVAATDRAGRITYVNEKFCEISGYEASELIGQTHRTVNSGHHPKAFFVEMWKTIAAGGIWQGEICNRARDGALYWVDTTIVPLVSEGRPAGYLSIRYDITARKRVEASLKQEVERDPLTGLHNRRVLMERLERISSPRRKSDTCGALVLIDLDHFKNVNDTLGHLVGDDLLRLVADRLRNAVRSNDVVARLGGDEFAILLPEFPSDTALQRLLIRLRNVLEAPMQLEGRLVRTGASLGVSCFPSDSRDPGELLRFADMALYRAKEAGRGGYRFFSPELSQRVERRDRVAARLREAIDRKEITIALQPQFCIQTGAHSGFETLARWYPEGLEVTPAEFIAVAEEAGLIVPLGDLVLEQAIRAATQMQRQGLLPGVVAVNVAAAQLTSEDFATSLASRLTKAGLAPASFEIEVTETVLLADNSALICRTLQALHDFGIGIALDDFGTGYASLTHLRRFPVDRLKVDRSFVSGILDDHGDEAIVRTIVALARSLGKSVVAEGIETDQQLARLRALGCEVGQGFLVSRPLTPADAEAYLRALPAANSVVRRVAHFDRAMARAIA